MVMNRCYMAYCLLKNLLKNGQIYGLTIILCVRKYVKI